MAAETDGFMDFEEIKKHLLEASDTQLDASMKPLIKDWANPPTSLQVLEVLDQCIYASLASGLCVTALQMMYDDRLKDEGRTHEQNVPLAEWRQKCA